MLGSSRVAAQLADSQEGLSHMKLVNRMKREDGSRLGEGLPEGATSPVVNVNMTEIMFGPTNL
jgi:hypothetical protein